MSSVAQCVIDFSPSVILLSNNRVFFPQSNDKQGPKGDKLHGYEQKMMKFLKKGKGAFRVASLQLNGKINFFIQTGILCVACSMKFFLKLFLQNDKSFLETNL